MFVKYIHIHQRETWVMTTDKICEADLPKNLNTESIKQQHRDKHKMFSKYNITKQQMFYDTLINIKCLPKYNIITKRGNYLVLKLNK